MNFRKTLMRVLRIPATLNAVREGGENWALDRDEVLADHQLRQLNEVWADALANVPFYKWWQERHHLPERIASLEDYATWPVLTEGDLQAHPDLLVRRCKDFLNNTYRADACDLSPRSLRFVLDKLSRHQPEVIILARRG